MKRIIIVLFICLTVIILLGYLSAFLSLRSCEKHLARIIADETKGIGSEYVIETNTPGIVTSENYSNAVKILREAGINLRAAASLDEPRPWITISNARIFLPFIDKVEYARMDGLLAGRGNAYFYIALFGYVYPFKIRRTWNS
jgi:hypothetical protein